jgi:hypothetical protein
VPHILALWNWFFYLILHPSIQCLLGAHRVPHAVLSSALQTKCSHGQLPHLSIAREPGTRPSPSVMQSHSRSPSSGIDRSSAEEGGLGGQASHDSCTSACPHCLPILNGNWAFIPKYLLTSFWVPRQIKVPVLRHCFWTHWSLPAASLRDCCHLEWWLVPLVSPGFKAIPGLQNWEAIGFGFRIPCQIAFQSHTAKNYFVSFPRVQVGLCCGASRNPKAQDFCPKWKILSCTWPGVLVLLRTQVLHYVSK